MSDSSPLFVSSLELLAHATEIFASKNPKKYKFVILHLANSIELILKDRVVDLGISIYEPKTNRTIGIWDCFNKLETSNISIPEKPIIELLIDDRNTIQHRFGYPDEQTVFYYLEKVTGFFQTFLDCHYRVQLAEVLKLHLSKEHLELLGLSMDSYGNADEFGHLDELLKVAPEFSIVAAFRDLENKLMGLLEISLPEGVGHANLYNVYRNNLEGLFRDLISTGSLTADDFESFHNLRSLKNEIVHVGNLNLTNNEISEKINFSKNLITKLQGVQDAGYRFVAINIPRSFYIKAQELTANRGEEAASSTDLHS